MWLQKLKKKKLQCFLIGMLIFLSALIFSTSLSLVTSIKDYVNKYYANDKYYDVILFSADESAKNNILNWCKNNSQIDAAKNYETFASGNDLYKNNENLKISSYGIVPIDNVQKMPYGLNKVKYLNNNKSPGVGEVWVTQLFADSSNVSLGDTLKFKVKGKIISLKITALINDSLQPSSLVGVIYLYTNKNSADDFVRFTKQELIFIKPKKGANVKDIEKNLSSAIHTGGYEADKGLLIQSATTVASMIGGASALASVLIFVASVFLIRFIMWSTILKEYKSIGIYKALGFRSKDILKFYIVGYSLIAILGSTLGVFASIPMLNYTSAKVLKYIGEFKDVNINFNVIIFTVVLFSLIVILNLYFVIRKTNKITPVEALMTGVTSSRKKLTKSLIKDNCSPKILAINDIFKYKKTSISITLSLTLALTLIILFGNVNFTISKMAENVNTWFGIPKTDITISSSGTKSKEKIKNVLSDVKKDTRVKSYSYGSIMGLSDIVLDTKKYKIKSSVYNISAMNSYNNDLGFSIINGHNPRYENEVAVSLNILKEAGLTIGDYIELSINNKKKSYLISGSYNSLMSNGYGIRMLNAAVERENPKFAYDEIFINLKNTNNIEKFENGINGKFQNINASDIEPTIKYTIKSIPGIGMPITDLLIVVFVFFSIITILNILIMNIRDNKRNFGIMKALGFTNKEIRNRYLYKILLLTIISIFLSIMLNMIFAKQLIALVITVDVLIISPVITLAVVLAMFLLIMLITNLCCTTINSAKPTELIEE